MKLFHRITISLNDEEMKLLEDLRRDSGESLSQIFREALTVYYNLIKACRKSKVDFRKYFNDIDRLATHIHGVESRQFVIIDRELYRVLLKKIQELGDPEQIVDEEFVNAVRGLANLFKIEFGWDENTPDIEKAETVLKMIEFAGGGVLQKYREKLVFQTPPENLIVTKILIKTLFEQLGINTVVETALERIFIRIKN